MPSHLTSRRNLASRRHCRNLSRWGCDVSPAAISAPRTRRSCGSSLPRQCGNISGRRRRQSRHRSELSEAGYFQHLPDAVLFRRS